MKIWIKGRLLRNLLRKILWRILLKRIFRKLYNNHDYIFKLNIYGIYINKGIIYIYLYIIIEKYEELLLVE